MIYVILLIAAAGIGIGVWLKMKGSNKPTPPTTPPPQPPPVVFVPDPTPLPGGQTVAGGSAITSVMNGAYAVQNNEWGSTANFALSVVPDSGAFKIIVCDIDQTTKPVPDCYAPGCFASVFQGTLWGGNYATSGSLMPIALNQIKSVRSSWSIGPIPEGAGQYDAGYDIWFNTTAAHTGQPDGTEFGVTLSYTKGWTPAGSIIDHAVIGGVAYTIWGSHEFPTPNYIVYARDEQTLQVIDFDLLALFQDAVTRGYIKPEWYLQSIQAGFEVWKNGTGLTSNSFSVTIDTEKV